MFFASAALRPPGQKECRIQYTSPPPHEQVKSGHPAKMVNQHPEQAGSQRGAKNIAHKHHKDDKQPEYGGESHGDVHRRAQNPPQRHKAFRTVLIRQAAHEPFTEAIGDKYAAAQ